jgi:hypothetical protein
MALRSRIQVILRLFDAMTSYNGEQFVISLAHSQMRTWLSILKKVPREPAENTITNPT